jgi:hypothetical protein
MGLEERLNPVLVKEVRQALRGKQFKSTFAFTLVVSLVAAITIVVNNAEGAAWHPIGPAFLTGLFSCLAIAVVGFVPLAAFNAMGAEFEENTYDMLVLSHMRPRHIMLGKLLAAGVQALLYFSVFGFFVVFAFLLGGVDLTLVAVSLPLLAAISLALSSLALGLSTLSPKRSVRVVLMVALSAALVASAFSVIGLQIAMMEESVDLGTPEAKTAISVIFLASLTIGSLFFVIGTARLAHEEENRSTGLRLLGFVLVLVSLGWSVWFHSFIGRLQVFLVFPILAAFGASALGIFFVSEREGLGRRVATTLPKSKLLRLLILPWLPGGGRGTIWLLGVHALILGFTSWMVAGSALGSFMGMTPDGVLRALLATMSYSVVYLLLPAALFTNRTRRLQRSTLVRIVIPAFVLLGFLLPTVLGFILGEGDLAGGQHYGNPFWTIAKGIEGDVESWPLWLAAFLTILLQVPRLVRAVREVLLAPAPEEL